MTPTDRVQSGRWVLHRRLSAPPVPPGIAPGLPAVIPTACWFGAVLGLAEAALLPMRQDLDPRVTADWLRMNHHYAWMVPVADLVLLAALGLLLAPWARLRPGVVGRANLALHVLLAALAPLLVSRLVHPLACVALAAGFASRVVPRITAHGQGFRRLVRWSLGPLLGAIGLLAAIGHGRVEHAESRSLAALPAASPGAPNVLLIVLDTVRADHLSAYGWHRETSPNLARFAARGVRFTQARSTAPWTLPSHASLFTGHLPHELSAGDSLPLDASRPTLSEWLSRHGYATAGFAANTYYCNARFGIARGFAHYEDYTETREVTASEILRCSELGRRIVLAAERSGLIPSREHGHRRDAAEIGAAFLSWLDRPGREERPFFAFLNYFDAHDPYVVPAWFPRRLGTVPANDAERAAVHRWHDSARRLQPQRTIDLVRDAYDDCIAALDEQLGRTLDELDRRGVLRDTYVLITSDHGESFGEHQIFGHGKSLYRPEIHVPLIVVGPGIPAGLVCERPVSLRDVPATVARWANRGPAAPFPGRSLARSWEGPPGGDAPVISEVRLTARDERSRAIAKLGPRAAMTVEGKTFIQYGDGREQLFDLASDPAEAHDLAALPETRETLTRYRELLKRSVPEKATVR